jgi:hypothetical protein
MRDIVMQTHQRSYTLPPGICSFVMPTVIWVDAEGSNPVLAL